jgi:hypothetical protein
MSKPLFNVGDVVKPGRFSAYTKIQKVWGAPEFGEFVYVHRACDLNGRELPVWQAPYLEPESSLLERKSVRVEP